MRGPVAWVSSRVEMWRPVVGFYGRYDVSSLGRVRSWLSSGRSANRLQEPRLRKLVPNKLRGGYLTVLLSRRPRDLKLMFVHQLVLEAFVGSKPYGMVGRHVDDRNVTNNKVGNLAWGTQSQNVQDSIRHGTDTRGPRNGMAKLSMKDVNKIRRRLRHGEMGCYLAAEFGVSQATISRIKHGTRYR